MFNYLKRRTKALEEKAQTLEEKAAEERRKSAFNRVRAEISLIVEAQQITDKQRREVVLSKALKVLKGQSQPKRNTSQIFRP